MITIHRITNATDPYYNDAIALYKGSFPSHELREGKSQIEILSNPLYHFDVIFDEGIFIGEILYWEVGEFLYIEHFCISPEMRNKRYGQNVLKMYQDRPLILEIDPPIDEISIRRKGFYERCGFVENPYPHIHPPYHKANKGHDLVIMSSPEGLTKHQATLFQDFLRDVVMKNVY